MDPGIPGPPTAQPATSSQDQPDFLMDMGEMTKQVCCIKYSLMACNAFGIMMGIFVVLFGMSYPEEKFPGGYRGKETAGISCFFIIFTLIGYYGAHRQKIYFLVPYSIIIFLFLGGNLIMWGIKPDVTVLNPDSNSVIVMAAVFIVLMIFALWLAWQERKKGSTMGNVSVMSSSMSYPMVAMNGGHQQAMTAPSGQQLMLSNQGQRQPQQQPFYRQPPLMGQGGPFMPQSGGFGYPPQAIPFDLNSKNFGPYNLSVFYEPSNSLSSPANYVTLPTRGPPYQSGPPP